MKSLEKITSALKGAKGKLARGLAYTALAAAPMLYSGSAKAQTLSLDDYKTTESEVVNKRYWHVTLYDDGVTTPGQEIAYWQEVPNYRSVDELIANAANDNPSTRPLNIHIIAPSRWNLGTVPAGWTITGQGPSVIGENYINEMVYPDESQSTVITSRIDPQSTTTLVNLYIKPDLVSEAMQIENRKNVTLFNNFFRGGGETTGFPSTGITIGQNTGTVSFYNNVINGFYRDLNGDGQFIVGAGLSIRPNEGVSNTKFRDNIIATNAKGISAANIPDLDFGTEVDPGNNALMDNLLLNAEFEAGSIGEDISFINNTVFDTRLGLGEPVLQSGSQFASQQMEGDIESVWGPVLTTQQEIYSTMSAPGLPAPLRAKSMKLNKAAFNINVLPTNSYDPLGRVTGIPQVSSVEESNWTHYQ